MHKINVRALPLAAMAAVALPAAAQEPSSKSITTGLRRPKPRRSRCCRRQLGKLGVKWKDFAVVQHDTGANVTVINMITGGTPPDVFLEASPASIATSRAWALASRSTHIFDEVGATPNFADAVKKNITVDGEIVKAPVAVHLDGMLFYNKEVAAKAGVDPTAWTSMDDVWADFDKVKAAGFIPIAIGSQKWQEGYLFHALMAAYGTDIYDGFYAAEPDTRDLRQPIDADRCSASSASSSSTPIEGSTNRDWNVTTNLVITGKALMQIHGDWMKGEFRNAGKEAGKDFGCINIPGAQAVSVTVDAWGFIKNDDRRSPRRRRSSPRWWSIRRPSAEFAAKKGSTPVVLNAPDRSARRMQQGRARHAQGSGEADAESAQHRRRGLVQRDMGRGRSLLDRPDHDRRSGDRRLPGGLRLDLLGLQLTNPERAASDPPAVFTSRAEGMDGMDNPRFDDQVIFQVAFVTDDIEKTKRWFAGCSST